MKKKDKTIKELSDNKVAGKANKIFSSVRWIDYNEWKFLKEGKC